MKDLIAAIRKALGEGGKELADKLEAAADKAVTEIDEAKQEAAETKRKLTAAEKAAQKATTDLDAKTKGESEELAKLRASEAKLTADLEAAGGEVGKVKLSYALREAASKAGLRDPDALAMLDASGVSLGDDGKLVGFDKAHKAWKTAKPYLFGDAPAGGGSDGGKGPAGANNRGEGGAGGGGGEKTPAERAREMLQRQGYIAPTQQQGQGQGAQ